MPANPKRTTWITGTSSGIGYALGLEFGVRGDVVVLSGRRESNLLELQSTLRRKGATAFVVPCDVRTEESVREAVRETVAAAGVPNILINNAGVTVFKRFLDTSVQEFDDILNTNLRGAFLVTKEVLPLMIERQHGLIMNVVSYAARTTYTESSVYAASKAGLAAMMEGLRAEVRAERIKIVNVFPGAVLTPIWHPKVQAKHGDKMMTAEDLAKMIYQVSCQPPSMMVEEIVMRPQGGDIKA